MPVRETQFSRELREELKELFPGCIILRNDPNQRQGIPDLIILYEDKWAALEVKRSRTAAHQPNQDYYVDLLNEMSYSNFIFPENKEEILDEIQQTFRTRRKTRYAKR